MTIYIVIVFVVLVLAWCISRRVTRIDKHQQHIRSERFYRMVDRREQ
jgi:hypothetical protein